MDIAFISGLLIAAIDVFYVLYLHVVWLLLLEDKVPEVDLLGQRVCIRNFNRYCLSLAKKVVAACNTRCLSSSDVDGLLGKKLLIFRYFKKSLFLACSHWMLYGTEQ